MQIDPSWEMGSVWKICLKIDLQLLIEGEQEDCCFDSKQRFITCFKAFKVALFDLITSAFKMFAVAEVDSMS